MTRLQEAMAVIDAESLTADERIAYDELIAGYLGSTPGAVVYKPDGISQDRFHEIAQAARASAAVEIAAGQRAGEGRKDDDGKLPLHLLPTDALEAITEILDFGQKKYTARNWEKGMRWSRVYRATLGHLFKWWAGVPADAETGKSHLWHAGCCILFLITYELRGAGEDDRPTNSV